MANFSQWLEQKEAKPELLNESRKKRLTSQERLAKLKKSKKSGKWSQLSSKEKKMVALSFRTSMKGMKKGGSKMTKRGASTLESIEDKGLFPRLIPSFGI